MHHTSAFVSLVAALAIVACSSTTAGPGGGPTGTASQAQIDNCKQSCDKMKFFGCNSAEEQARCYTDCSSATPSQIDIFTGCADNSICDPACRTKIQPAGSGQGGVSGGGTSGGTGATASSCATACDKLISCSFIPLGAKAQCNSECSTKGYQYQIDCVNNNACDKIQSACGGGGSTITVDPGDAGADDFDVRRCQSECDSINFFKCAPVESHAACRAKCTTAAANVRDDFTSCSSSSGGDCDRKGACLDTFLK